ncbi:ribosome maturation factor RimP [Vandammella animalimorsus]|uniref:Ribosome maturation factor RimP n=1 Tax=Vandammella animalimorsus TaxID=2029117 RepID=A0A3M6RKD8_9BURK|nr:ribosome maturation factor RimP [Vandammella animalimorsus]RMX15398.1 ribosome maturation factor RimP [Vandammella animalimorsus]
MALQQVVEQTVAGLGFDLVEVERSAGGLLRVTIDVPWQEPAQTGPDAPDASDDALGQGAPAQSGASLAAITVEDCEVVTRQLQFALEVEGVDYARLEVSSPGIDRLLRHEQDLRRFSGEVVDVVLKQPIGAAAQGQVSANRKRFRGQLQAGQEPDQWQVVWTDEPERKPGQKVSKKYVPPPAQALGFTLDEVKEVRLAPIVNFKGPGARGR